MITLRHTTRAGAAVNLHLHVNIGRITIPLSESQLVKFLAHADTASQGRQVRTAFAHFNIASFTAAGYAPFTIISADGVSIRLDMKAADWGALLRTTTSKEAA